MQKTLYIIRGIPGSGKSTLGRSIAPDHCYAADDFFTDQSTGEYLFKPEQVQQAHEYCRAQISLAMTLGAPVIAVANTFRRKWEMESYINIANRNGYSIFVLECQNEWANVHGVPAARVAEMKAQFER